MSADVINVKISDLAQTWGIRRLAVFGSCAKGTARLDSDIDLLVEFQEKRKPSLIGHITLGKILSERFQRNADLSTFESIQNAKNIRRKEAILSEAVDLFCDA